MTFQSPINLANTNDSVSGTGQHTIFLKNSGQHKRFPGLYEIMKINLSIDFTGNTIS